MSLYDNVAVPLGLKIVCVRLFLRNGRLFIPWRFAIRSVRQSRLAAAMFG